MGLMVNRQLISLVTAAISVIVVLAGQLLKVTFS